MHDSKYLVQLEENARSRLVVAVFIFLRALSPRRYIYVANFAGRCCFTVVARHSLLFICRGSRFLIFWTMSKFLSCTIIPIDHTRNSVCLIATSKCNFLFHTTLSFYVQVALLQHLITRFCSNTMKKLRKPL